ncbi:unnamed protein product [Penicillium olsonii]|uniref:Shikimate dehydrogenase substrate binding N-terminal domain-containing protein n=1 Tax=Penicillium olsonii TaxID=99116 RepID=A0A9W4MWS7_PENOL|nr:unnamed protein product [Penicillium olsonii]CAG8201648.1 unnamed protein product [Penicillium olsonii]
MMTALRRPGYERPTIYQVSHQRTVYLFGQPIAHSVSPVFHNAIFRNLGLPWRYIRLDSKDPDDLAWLMHREDFIGAAVTMPNKIRAMEQVDILTPDARKTGCINTIYVRPSGPESEQTRTYIGTNTDWIGIQRALLNADPDFRSRFSNEAALVIGGGATCRSAIYALTEGLGFKVVYLVNRDPAEAKAAIRAMKQEGLSQDIYFVETIEMALSIPSPPTVAVSAVPDLAPKTAPEQAARDMTTALIQRSQESPSPPLFLEMCYDPTPMTWLATAAKSSGWRIIDGLDVMEHQAIEQAALWTGKHIQDLPSSVANAKMRLALR